ncbi:MAG: hypothetical protein C4527_03745 [Candidatus Omnitrophota bacterium]|jgi:hypothetical protein|nr:MAG: hypothetical protein C4527_03745 [Candidatus Omnitrophota bacterium]
MDAKLTLKLNKEIIEQAKHYAQEKQCSLSWLVESYFRFLIERKQSSSIPEISSTVKELSGIIQLDDNEKIRDDYTNYLLQKYQ